MAKHLQVSFSFIKVGSRSYLKQKHVYMNAWLTLLHHSIYASMHGHILCMVMAYQSKK